MKDVDIGQTRSAQAQQPLTIYIVSGGTGASGDQVVRTILAQFPTVDVPVIIKPYVRSRQAVEGVVSEAAGNHGLIVHTLVDQAIRADLLAYAGVQHVVAIDLVGPLLDQIAAILGCEPLGQPGLYRHMRQEYFERIDAIEFTVAHDDGRRPEDWHLADIVLAGVSRAGKTPLSMYLSTQGWSVANVPLVKEIPVPPELFHLDSRRVVGLDVDPQQLITYRQWRQRHLHLPSNLDYVDLDTIYEEVEYARRLFRQHRFKAVDMTGKPVEEAAREVLMLVSPARDQT